MKIDTETYNKMTKELQDLLEVKHEPNCPCKMLDLQSGDRKGWSSQKHSKFNPYSGNALLKSETERDGFHEGYNDKGGASRFFYTAKASKSERNLGCERLEIKQKIFNGQSSNSSKDMKDVEERFTTKPSANNHPTVKPLKLMEYLCTLTKTPTGGVVFDPFMGSGTTGIACVNTDREFIGIEKEADYVRIAEARIKKARELKNRQKTLF